MRKFIILLLLLFIPSCAKTLPGKIGQMHSGVKGVRTMSRVVLDDRCLAVAKKCPKLPVGEEHKCLAWKTCRDIRRIIYKAASAVQIMLDTALSLSASGQDDAAKSMFDRAVEAFNKLKENLIKYKVLEISSVVIQHELEILIAETRYILEV